MAQSDRVIAGFGSWRSPITSDLVVGKSLALSEVRLDRGMVYWVERRPDEGGRSVIVRQEAGGARDVTPPGFDVRTRAHEYGGGAWTVAQGILYFSNGADGRLYRQPVGESPAPMTGVPPTGRGQDWRFADGIVDPSRGRWIGVREDHTAAGQPLNCLVAVDLVGASDGGRILAQGHDFYSSPRISPDGGRLLYLAWDHPNMPWDGTLLYLSEIEADGSLGRTSVLAGGAEESIFQPEWTPDGKGIVFVSDRSGWWNLYLTSGAGARPLAPLAAEFGLPQWVFALSTYAFLDSKRILCARRQNGVTHLGVLDLDNGALRDVPTPFTEFNSVRAEAGLAAFCAGAPDQPWSVTTMDIRQGNWVVVRKATGALDANPDLVRWFSNPNMLQFPTEGGRTAFGLFYPPTNPDHEAPAGERPPLLVRAHGGPTSWASSVFALAIQFWTSRGIAVLDVNYGGSTGFGRAYRERLDGAWGVVDVDDCVAGATHLAQQGWVDPARCVISGGSAGGYTALCALTFRDFFRGGASYYGVSDLERLASDTHKFESRYLDKLVGPYPAEAARYRARSPALHADRLQAPVIFFQGEEDAVVPPSQTEAMVEALRRKGQPVEYFLFPGEQHGFRNGANIRRCLEAEFAFYARNVFGTALTP